MSNKTRHFFLFYLMGVVINCTGYFLIAEHFKQGSDFAVAANITYMIYPMVFCVIMIKTYKADKRMDLMQKLVPSIIYITLNILYTITMNMINPYDRVIEMENIVAGIDHGFTIGSVQIILLIPVLYFVKSGIEKKQTTST